MEALGCRDAVDNGLAVVERSVGKRCSTRAVKERLTGALSSSLGMVARTKNGLAA
jgi:hypothetical protein